MIPATDLTRSALIEHMRNHRVTLDSVQGAVAFVTIDHGRRSQLERVPLDWVKPMLVPREPRREQAR